MSSGPRMVDLGLNHYRQEPGLSIRYRGGWRRLYTRTPTWLPPMVGNMDSRWCSDLRSGHGVLFLGDSSSFNGWVLESSKPVPCDNRGEGTPWLNNPSSRAGWDGRSRGGWCRSLSLWSRQLEGPQLVNFREGFAFTRQAGV
ncbi:hypothetical protein E2C01_055183 [Portunus trituberculatus]|uniref:Uncharacterized protein n=1 Tax=Portunus trituberculatus TaxID=210409 RepID=A0A5B7GU55_PORTR|nr:hypothetical protein [Portunus trituberculatus]